MDETSNQELEFMNGTISLYKELHNLKLAELREIEEKNLSPIDLRLSVAYVNGQLDLLVIMIETLESELELLKQENERIQKELDLIE